MRRRRLCTSPHHRGPRWISHIEFHVKLWGDPEKTWIAQYQSVCRTCTRIHNRAAVAKRKGRDKPFNPWRPRQTPEQRREAARARYARRRRDPAYMENKRAKERENAAFRRRRAGIPPRQFKRSEAPLRATTASVAQVWLRCVKVARADLGFPSDRQSPPIGRVAHVYRYLGLTTSEFDRVDRAVRRFLAGESGRVTVPFDLVDKAMVATGLQFLSADIEVLSQETPDITSIEGPL